MIIAFTGKMQSGKTTAAFFLKQKGLLPINFKDALIEEVIQNFPDLLAEISPNISQLFKDKPPLIRKLLQNYGTNVRRKDNPDYWVNKWRRKATATTQNIVVDDVRFLNEAKAVKELGGLIIKITRPNFTGDDHQSEKEMDMIKPDYEICNHTTIANLHQELKKIYVE